MPPTSSCPLHRQWRWHGNRREGSGNQVVARTGTPSTRCEAPHKQWKRGGTHAAWSQSERYYFGVPHVLCPLVAASRVQIVYRARAGRTGIDLAKSPPARGGGRAREGSVVGWLSRSPLRAVLFGQLPDKRARAGEGQCLWRWLLAAEGDTQLADALELLLGGRL